MIVLRILLLIVILGIIILVHEFGHFFFAKLFKVHIYEFSIGMGPVIFSKKGKDNIKYNLRALPIGGFVAMAGEVYEDDDKVAKERLLCNRPWLQRFMILVAGVMNNFILAIVILFVIGCFFGGAITKPVVNDVVEGYPAIDAGLKKGDTIISINGYRINNWDKAQLVLLFKDKDNKYVFKVKGQDGKKRTIKITPKVEKDEDGNKVNKFGIEVKNTPKYGFINGIKYAFLKFVSIYETMFLTLFGLFTRKISINALSGPVGMYKVVGESLKYGFINVVYLTAFLSINVGFINILPFPAFDGGHVLFMIIEKLKGSPVNQKLENTIHTIGFFILLALMLYITVLDIFRLF
ncbi:MAG: RIP metalloprotease RseP [Bacilli bacterium]|nr:RIP metalloprotease RseP [Bacilli bacterium]